MSNQKKSFWMSLPGVLTGVAAIIAAITGLYIALDQREDSPPPAQTVSPSVVSSPAEVEDNSAYKIHVLFSAKNRQDAIEISAALASAGFSSRAVSMNEFLLKSESLLKTVGTRVFPTPSILLGGDVPQKKIEAIKEIMSRFLEENDIAVHVQIRAADGSIQVLGLKQVAVFP